MHAKGITLLPMKIQFQADADFNAEIVLGLLRREPRIDFQSSVMNFLRVIRRKNAFMMRGFHEFNQFIRQQFVSSQLLALSSQFYGEGYGF